MRRRTFHIYLSLLAAVLLGTVVVLSSFSYYLAIDNAAYLSEDELDAPEYTSRWNATQHGKVERIPRILHQTWKSDILPSDWKTISEACREMMPDYEYMLWSDESSRNFIAENYSWFLDTFDSYTYPIQRADAIRYFVLHHYGGVYLDLDVGCLRPLDPLLIYSVILPKTIPVGVSNDLMFAEKGHPFMAQTIHNLATFDHSWVLNYPTVMFSTGPMFLSAQYGLYTASNPAAPGALRDIRILPKALYGKNALPSEAPHSFFSHYYGSSWHADDAVFISFLGHWGKVLMAIGLVLLLFGLARLAIPSHKRRRIGGYEVVMPRWTQRNGRWHLDLGWFTLPASGSPTQSNSPTNSPMSGDDLPLLPMQLDVRLDSPPPSDLASMPHPSSSVIDTARQFKSWILSRFGLWDHSNIHSPYPRRPRPTRDVLYFLPAIFRPGRDVEEAFPSHLHSSSRSLIPSKGVIGDIDVLDLQPYQVSTRTGRRPANSPSISLSDESPSDDGSSTISWAS